MNNRSLILTAIFLLAFGLRVYNQMNTYPENPVISDAGEYYTGALNIIHNGFYAVGGTAKGPGAKRTPGYSLFLVPFVLLSESVPVQDRGAQIVIAVTLISFFQAILGALTCVFTFLLAEVFLPFKIALTAALLAICSPHLIAMDQLILSETLFAFLLTLTLLMHARGYNLLTGLGCGLLTLVRPIGVGVVLVFALCGVIKKGRV